jgi:hypothetical protein
MQFHLNGFAPDDPSIAPASPDGPALKEASPAKSMS